MWTEGLWPFTLPSDYKTRLREMNEWLIFKLTSKARSRHRHAGIGP